MGNSRLGWDKAKQLIAYFDDYNIMTEAALNALSQKHKCIVYTTDDTPTTTGWVDGTVVLIYVE